MLKRTFILSLLPALIVMLSCGLAQATTVTTVTIATFADPAVNGSTPLFTIDLFNDIIAGGWADDHNGLTLKIPYTGNTYPNAFFTMTNVVYPGSISGGSTGGGTIKFFADGQDTNTTPLIRIDFASGHVTPLSFGAMDLFYSDGVTITGSEIGALTDESFAFGFANHAPLKGDWNKGYTATASFTSSAAVPEPTTIGLLGLGALNLFRRNRRASCNQKPRSARGLSRTALQVLIKERKKEEGGGGTLHIC